MEIGAFVPLSLSDHEGRVAAVVFVRGCNFRCPFCHNPDLVLPDRSRPLVLEAADVVRHLAERRELLDSVVVTGGEPTLQPDISSFLAEIRAIGLGAKLDTNGSRPDVLSALLYEKLVDYVAMDVKAPRARYAEYAGASIDLAALDESMRVLREQAVDYEFRTTVAPGLSSDDLVAIASWIRGAARYVLQPFRVPHEKGLVDPTWETRTALSPEALRDVWEGIAPLVRGGGVRA